MQPSDCHMAIFFQNFYFSNFIAVKILQGTLLFAYTGKCLELVWSVLFSTIIWLAEKSQGGGLVVLPKPSWGIPRGMEEHHLDLTVKPSHGMKKLIGKRSGKTAKSLI